MSLVFVTCYNAQLYHSSGHKLKRSAQFFKNLPFKTFSEDTAPADYKINQTALDSFLQAYQEYIPEKYGGSSSPCECPKKRFGKHEYACHHSLWNESAFRWFKKVVTLYQCLEWTYDYLVWIDCDSFFKKTLPEGKVIQALDGTDVAYLKGTRREAIETGFIIFDFSSGRGQEIIKKWMGRFRNGIFLTDHRWDDGFQFTRVLQNGRWKTKDLAENYDGPSPADHCILKEYFQHNKGSHARKRVV